LWHGQEGRHTFLKIIWIERGPVLDGLNKQNLVDKKPAFKKIFSCNNKEIVITSNGLNVNTKRSSQAGILATVILES